MTKPTTPLSRRGFLFAVGAGGVATAAAMTGKVVPETEPVRASDDKRATRGYHASQHVNTYYRTVKF
jgi:hypothetical protein